jgi:hypothetical protein
VSADSTLTNEYPRREVTERNAALAELALAKEWHRHEVAMQAAMSAARSLTAK